MKPFALFIRQPACVTAVMNTTPGAEAALGAFLQRASIGGSGLVACAIDPDNLLREPSYFPIDRNPQVAVVSLGWPGAETEWFECEETETGFYVTVHEGGVLQPRESTYRLLPGARCAQCEGWAPRADMLEVEGECVDRVCVMQYITDTAKYWGLFRAKTAELLIYDKVQWDDSDYLIRKVTHSFAKQHKRVEPQPRKVVPFTAEDPGFDLLTWTTYPDLDGVVVVIHTINEE